MKKSIHVFLTMVLWHSYALAQNVKFSGFGGVGIVTNYTNPSNYSYSLVDHSQTNVSQVPVFERFLAIKTIGFQFEWCPTRPKIPYPEPICYFCPSPPKPWCRNCPNPWFFNTRASIELVKFDRVFRINQYLKTLSDFRLNLGLPIVFKKPIRENLAIAIEVKPFFSVRLGNESLNLYSQSSSFSNQTMFGGCLDIALDVYNLQFKIGTCLQRLGRNSALNSLDLGVGYQF